MRPFALVELRLSLPNANDRLKSVATTGTNSMLKLLRSRFFLFFSAAIGLALLMWGILLVGSKSPVAWIQVVDVTGKPISGAVITPEGLRTKSGPYSSGWYVWSKEFSRVPNDIVTTDADGIARIPYPTYVFEKIETGVIIPSVDHPDYVLEQPELIVTTTPPAGSPWQVWASYLWNKIRRKSLVARTDTVVLKTGAILKLSLSPDFQGSKGSSLFAQISEGDTGATNFWIRPEPAVLLTRRLASGPQTIRAIQLSADGTAWFSDPIKIKAVSGQTNDVVVELKPGVTVRGQLDDTVPRPVKNGRVVAHVWPTGFKPSSSPPQWHIWTTNREDGTFEFANLPPGDLEIVALCQGFVSTTSPGTKGFRHPQKHLLGTNDLSITVEMEPTARLEVFAIDDKGNSLKDATISTWPNVRYGDWSAVVLMSDLYNTSDHLLKPETRLHLWNQNVPDLTATTDNSGLAVFENLPADVAEFSVEHSRFELPAMTRATGRKVRESAVTLTPGGTNKTTVRLEPRNNAPIRHY